ncbi:Cyclophilin-type peptidyl-prolyl cis-trans isomerase domain [Arabidopsis suecica]|uniref:Cyclophilin-type peptidyl-prolyl cis-trans isomerase domain n=1 Tax=Arabidopsis suecica TaxID=45249 RepID=A0A8T2AFJ8_ARASU|nr:Cyclophilin-type peptidyl-prolyl cis-trans isomerase domain [Arabidopsis suecica]
MEKAIIDYATDEEDSVPVIHEPSLNPDTPLIYGPSLNPDTPVIYGPSLNPHTPVIYGPSLNPDTPVMHGLSLNPDTPVMHEPSLNRDRTPYPSTKKPVLGHYHFSGKAYSIMVAMNYEGKGGLGVSGQGVEEAFQPQERSIKRSGLGFMGLDSIIPQRSSPCSAPENPPAVVEPPVASQEDPAPNAFVLAAEPPSNSMNEVERQNFWNYINDLTADQSRLKGDDTTSVAVSVVEPEDTSVAISVVEPSCCTKKKRKNRRRKKKNIKAKDDEDKKDQLEALLTFHTSLGDLKCYIFCDKAPTTSENFISLCASGYYDGTIFHRNIKGFIIQGGDPTGTGKGGTSIWGGKFKDEIHPLLTHNVRGILSMANSGPNSNGSQFFFTYSRQSHLNGSNTVFGRIKDGFEVLEMMEQAQTEIKLRSVTIHAGCHLWLTGRESLRTQEESNQ